MHVSRTGPKLASQAALIAAALFAAACGGVTNFQGQSAFSIAGTPPAPPPPPPVAEEPPPPPIHADARAWVTGTPPATAAGTLTGYRRQRGKWLVPSSPSTG